MQFCYFSAPGKRLWGTHQECGSAAQCGLKEGLGAQGEEEVAVEVVEEEQNE